jgi:Leucine-rich repeat (LRR) protein
LAKTLAKPSCDWKTFDQTQVIIDITNCSATTIDSNFLGTHNITVDKNDKLNHLRLQTGLVLLEDFTFNTAHVLIELVLRSNDIFMISEKAFSGLVSLKSLSLSYNNIYHLHKNTFFELTELKYLYIDYNKLTKFDFACLQKNLNLQNLELRKNVLVEFENSSPSFRLNNMSVLVLSENLLSALPLDNLPELPNLRYFFIDSNRLTQIDVEQIKLRFPGLTVLEFRSNKWDCFYLIEMIKNITAIIPRIEIDFYRDLDIKQLLHPLYKHLYKCVLSPTSNGNQRQIDVPEVPLEQIKQYKPTAEDRSNYTEVSSFSSIIITVSLISCMLVVLTLVLCFYSFRNKVYVAKDAEGTIDDMEMLCN